MGLYLCVFDGEDELEGVEVGSYADFDFFRTTVTELLEEGSAGSRFATLIVHSDSDGEWSFSESERLSLNWRRLAMNSNGCPPCSFLANGSGKSASRSV